MSYSALWDGHYGEPHSLLSQSVKKNNDVTTMAKFFANRQYGRAAFTEVLSTLIGATAGSTASATHKRIKATQNLSDNVQGGLREIETHESVNRVTTAADVTLYQEALALATKPATYVGDSSGNGGGGMLGY